MNQSYDGAPVKAGAAIKRVDITDSKFLSEADMRKPRYVWMPLHDISMIGKTQVQPMSTLFLPRARTVWIQPVNYKTADNRQEAFDSDYPMGKQEHDLISLVCNPYDQCAYLHDNYAHKGIQIFEHLTNKDPEVVIRIEEALLPEVPDNLIDLADFLSTQGLANIDAAHLDTGEKRLAELTLTQMLNGVQDAISYCRNLIQESEGELLQRRNKGVGRAHFDENDKFAYKMLRKEIPGEYTLDTKKESENLIKQLVSAIVETKGGLNPEPVQASSEQIRMFEATIAQMQKQMADLQSALIERDSAKAASPAVTVPNINKQTQPANKPK